MPDGFGSYDVGGKRTRGFGDVRRRINNLIRELPEETLRGAEKEFDIEMRASMADTPVLSGDLKKSHRRPPGTIERGMISVEIQVGEGLGIYPVIQHEELGYDHPRGGKAKFLEDVIKASAAHMAKRIADRVDLKRAVGS
jgi:hypothetical protein